MNDVRNRLVAVGVMLAGMMLSPTLRFRSYGRSAGDADMWLIMNPSPGQVNE